MSLHKYSADVNISALTSDDIEKDIERTFPRHELFTHGGAGQDLLRRVLRAYANIDQECGYCQGMSFIAAMFIMYLPEDLAFYGFLTAMSRIKPQSSGPRCNLPLRSMFLPTLAELQRVLVVYDKLFALVTVYNLILKVLSYCLFCYSIFQNWRFTSKMRAFFLACKTMQQL
jgi:hypothetical protein